MDQCKIGGFLRTLRKEKNLTQEQEAEIFNVSRRTVTRWETGMNMPDLSTLVDIADYYDVDIRELFNGERKSEKMNEKNELDLKEQNEITETVKKAAECSNNDMKKTAKIITVYLVIGIVSLLVNGVMNFFELGDTFWTGFIEGATIGLTICALMFALLYVTGRLTKISAAKKRILSRSRES